MASLIYRAVRGVWLKPMVATGAGMASKAPTDYAPARCEVVVTA
jgi:hypothetical protein